jgi:hypothetical protein
VLRNTRRPRAVSLPIVAALAWLASPNPAHAQSHNWTWTGGSTTSQDWADGGNWSPATAPPDDGTANLQFTAASSHLTPTHGAWAIHSLVFPQGLGAAHYEILSDGPITFRSDATQRGNESPRLVNTGGSPLGATVRGDLIIPADTELSTNGFITVGNSTGSRLNGGTSRGGALLIDGGDPWLLLDNGAIDPAARGLYLNAVRRLQPDVPGRTSTPAQLDVVPSNLSYVGTASSIDVAEFRSTNVVLRFPEAGVARNSVGIAATHLPGSAMMIIGDSDVAGPRTGRDAPRVYFNGITDAAGGEIRTLGRVTLGGGGNGPVDGVVGGKITVGSTTTFGTADTDPTKVLKFGDISVGQLATAVFDPTLGTPGGVTFRPMSVTGNLDLRGTAVFRNSANVSRAPTMTFDGRISGSGTVTMDLRSGPGWITFSPATRIQVGDGTSAPGDLTFKGAGPELGNLLSPERLSTLGGLGTVEFQRTDNQPFDMAGNAWSDARTTLRVTDSNPAGVDLRLNSAGGTHFAPNVVTGKGAAFDVAGNTLSFVSGAGTLVGPAAYGTLRPALAPEGGLTITGKSTGLSDLMIDLRLFQSAQEYGLLHATDDLVLVGADGSPTRLDVGAVTGGRFGQQLTIVSLDAGAALSGTFAGLPDGASIRGSGYDMVIHYNVDGGDGSANDVTLTFVPEPGASFFLAIGLIGLMRRPRRSA